MSDPYISDRQHPNNFQTGHANYSQLKPTFLRININNSNSGIDVPIGNMQLYVAGGGNLVPLWGCTELCTFYNNMDLYYAILAGDVDVYDEYEDYIDPTYFDELFWQHILEAYATNGESTRPDFTGFNGPANKNEDAYGEVIVTSSGYDDVSFTHRNIKVLRGLDYGHVPNRITFVTNRSYDNIHTLFPFQPSQHSKLMWVVEKRSSPSPSHYNDDRASFPEVFIKREDGSDLQAGDLSTVDGVEEAILHTSSIDPDVLEYRVVGLGASSGSGSGSGGGGSTTPTVTGWQETVHNRTNITGTFGYTFKYHQEPENNQPDGATCDIVSSNGLAARKFNPLFSGKGQKLKRAVLRCTGAAINGGTKASAVFVRVKLWAVYAGSQTVLHTLDLEVSNINNINTNNNLSVYSMILATWEDNDGLTLFDDTLYGVTFHPSNLDSRVNSISNFTLKLEGERDFV